MKHKNIYSDVQKIKIGKKPVCGKRKRKKKPKTLIVQLKHKYTKYYYILNQM